MIPKTKRKRGEEWYFESFPSPSPSKISSINDQKSYILPLYKYILTLESACLQISPVSISWTQTNRFLGHHINKRFWNTRALSSCVVLKEFILCMVGPWTVSNDLYFVFSSPNTNAPPLPAPLSGPTTFLRQLTNKCVFENVMDLVNFIDNKKNLFDSWDFSHVLHSPAQYPAIPYCKQKDKVSRLISHH